MESHAKPTVCLIDGDIVVYRAAASHEDFTNWGDGVTSVIIDEAAAKRAVRRRIEDILDATGCTECVVALSSPYNFRYKVLPTYKHNRQHKQDPSLREYLKDYIRENYHVEEWRGCEGDDVLGILSTRRPLGEAVICTLDKDLRQIPGWHYNWDHNVGLEWVTPEEGQRFFYKQILTGDTTDGYKGCPQVGPIKADRILDELEGRPEHIWWQRIVEAYEAVKPHHALKAYEVEELGEEHALAQARVARMCTDNDYGPGGPIWWTPPKDTNE